jgi:flagellar biosynthesis protein FliQ
MIFAIVAAILAYRKASGAGRRGWPWTLAAAGVFVGTQWIVWIIAVLLMGLGIAFFDWRASIIEETVFVGPITVVAIGASVFTTWLLFRYLDRPLFENHSGELYPQHPPPPTFGSPQ